MAAEVQEAVKIAGDSLDPQSEAISGRYANKTTVRHDHNEEAEHSNQKIDGEVTKVIIIEIVRTENDTDLMGHTSQGEDDSVSPYEV